MTPQLRKTSARSQMTGLQVVLVVVACLWRADAHAQYRLDSGDVVEVSVFGVQDFKRRTAINVDGDISLPLLGDIRAAGLTLAELRTKLRESLAKSNIIRSPDVTAEIVEHRPFYVNGNVAKPGAHAYQPSLTVRHAVAIAGGFSPRAQRDRVTLTHADNAGASRIVVPLGTSVSPGDTVLVGERWF